MSSAVASAFATGVAAPRALAKNKAAGAATTKRRPSRRGRVAARAAVAEPADANAREEDTAKTAVATLAFKEIQKDVIAPGVESVRCVCRDRLKFEVEYGMARGSTDNSYVVTGGDKIALVDLPDKSYADAFSKAVDCGSIDYVVLGHLSPKRVDALAALLDARPASSPAVEVWCSNPAAQVIYAALKPGTPASSDALAAAWKRGGLRARLRTIKSGDGLDLGGNRVLSFTTTPTPRWPDGVVTFDETSGLLFTSKLFSAHVATEEGAPSDAGVGFETYETDWRYFFDCMLAPMAKPTNAALDKIQTYIGRGAAAAAEEEEGIEEKKEEEAPPPPKSVAPKLAKLLNRVADNFGGSGNVRRTAVSKVAPMAAAAICPLHGPVIKSGKNELVREYLQWLETQAKRADQFAVAVIYASAYGNTSAMAQAIARGITKADVAVEMLNCELSTSQEVAEVMARTEGFCLGAPTLGGHMPTPVSNALGTIVKEASREYPAGVFGSFGWSGEAVDLMESRLTDGGFQFAFEPIRCKFKPTQEMLQVCEESGTDLAQAVKKLRKKKAAAEQKDLAAGSTAATAGASDTAAAVGRIVGSLCCVTAKKEETQSAMLASWVSQASFNPPALTVAVAKERAVESFLLKGSAFNLNVLQAGNEKDVIKALLKPFAPGENRFGDMDVKISEANGCAVVTEALSVLECEVTDRMEAGDHWIVLAKVNEGKLLKEEGLTAIHHRKVGTSY